MAGLFAPQHVALQLHFLQHIAVPHFSGGKLQAVLFTEAGKPHVREHGAHNGAAAQLAAAGKVQPADGHDKIAVHNFACLVHKQAAVCIAVEGHARRNIAVLFYIGLKGLHVGRAAVCVDVYAVRRFAEDDGIRPQFFKQKAGRGAGRAVGAVHRHLHTLQRIGHSGLQVLYIIAHGGGTVGNLPQPVAAHKGKGGLVQHKGLYLVFQLSLIHI